MFLFFLDHFFVVVQLNESEVSFVRRRCWQPCFYTDADEAGEDRAPLSLLQNKARVLGCPSKLVNGW